ncbi:MAG: 50S ribosomal protein L3 [Candidatus Taylorbacteria bacterium]
MKFLLGTKKGMTQVFNAEGTVFPATLVSATPSVVTQVKKNDTDGYEAVQVGYGERNKNKINKPIRGHIKELGNFKFLKEFRVQDTKFALGDKINVTVFQEGDIVTVTGVSKGKGFQGVVKRHGFAGGSRTHGQKHSEREPGAIGGGGGRAGGRVAKGIRMAGRMGGDKVSVKNLKVVKIDAENNEIYIGGAVPGRRGTLLEVKGF